MDPPAASASWESLSNTRNGSLTASTTSATTSKPRDPSPTSDTFFDATEFQSLQQAVATVFSTSTPGQLEPIILPTLQCLDRFWQQLAVRHNWQDTSSDWKLQILTLALQKLKQEKTVSDSLGDLLLERLKQYFAALQQQQEAQRLTQQRMLQMMAQHQLRHQVYQQQQQQQQGGLSILQQIQQQQQSQYQQRQALLFQQQQQQQAANSNDVAAAGLLSYSNSRRQSLESQSQSQASIVQELQERMRLLSGSQNGSRRGSGASSVGIANNTLQQPQPQIPSQFPVQQQIPSQQQRRPMDPDAPTFSTFVSPYPYPTANLANPLQVMRPLSRPSSRPSSAIPFLQQNSRPSSTLPFLLQQQGQSSLEALVAAADTIGGGPMVTGNNYYLHHEALTNNSSYPDNSGGDYNDDEDDNDEVGSSDENGNSDNNNSESESDSEPSQNRENQKPGATKVAVEEEAINTVSKNGRQRKPSVKAKEMQELKRKKKPGQKKKASKKPGASSKKQTTTGASKRQTKKRTVTTWGPPAETNDNSEQTKGESTEDVAAALLSFRKDPPEGEHDEASESSSPTEPIGGDDEEESTKATQRNGKNKDTIRGTKKETKANTTGTNNAATARKKGIKNPKGRQSADTSPPTTTEKDDHSSNNRRAARLLTRRQSKGQTLAEDGLLSTSSHISHGDSKRGHEMGGESKATKIGKGASGKNGVSAKEKTNGAGAKNKAKYVPDVIVVPPSCSNSSHSTTHHSDNDEDDDANDAKHPGKEATIEIVDVTKLPDYHPHLCDNHQSIMVATASSLARSPRVPAKLLHPKNSLKEKACAASEEDSSVEEEKHASVKKNSRKASASKPAKTKSLDGTEDSESSSDDDSAEDSKPAPGRKNTPKPLPPPKSAKTKEGRKSSGGKKDQANESDDGTARRGRKRSPSQDSHKEASPGKRMRAQLLELQSSSISPSHPRRTQGHRPRRTSQSQSVSSQEKEASSNKKPSKSSKATSTETKSAKAKTTDAKSSKAKTTDMKASKAKGTRDKKKEEEEELHRLLAFAFLPRYNLRQNPKQNACLQVDFKGGRTYEEKTGEGNQQRKRRQIWDDELDPLAIQASILCATPSARVEDILTRYELEKQAASDNDSDSDDDMEEDNKPLASTVDKPASLTKKPRFLPLDVDDDDEVDQAQSFAKTSEAWQSRIKFSPMAKASIGEREKGDKDDLPTPRKVMPVAAGDKGDDSETAASFSESFAASRRPGKNNPKFAIISALLSTKTPKSAKDEILTSYDAWQDNREKQAAALSEVEEAERALQRAKKRHQRQLKSTDQAQQAYQTLAQKHHRPDTRTKRQKRLRPAY